METLANSVIVICLRLRRVMPRDDRINLRFATNCNADRPETWHNPTYRSGSLSVRAGRFEGCIDNGAD